MDKRDKFQKQLLPKAELERLAFEAIKRRPWLREVRSIAIRPTGRHSPTWGLNLDAIQAEGDLTELQYRVAMKAVAELQGTYDLAD